MSFPTAYTYSEALAEITTSDELLDLLPSFVDPLGVTGIFIADLPSPRETLAPLIRLRGWNAAWIEHYNQQNYVHIDPIAQSLRETMTPYVWSEECSARRLTSSERRVMDEAKDAGLIDGFTIPIHGPRMLTSCVSFSTNGQPLERSVRHCLHFMALLTYHRLNELTRTASCSAATQTSASRLAPRELDCLYWAMRGMKSKEIAFQTRLSIRTVDQYIRTAILKLRAGNRGEAIRLAILNGLLKPS
ncbi:MULTISPECIES: LuxR family transcriptional regulator [unclassified Bradyrhizobium]|uniref:LuxR family transcriptional regulator n=1 Tax=unclassified Bradyrhizobium TaxID=2631580 RepID=UPI002915FAED|nr:MULTISPECIES: LuxR family transcriptional regulator [unclassified Bradyrhizobium]